MRLSMYILEDWLEKYHPQASIHEGQRRIRNVRMFSDEHDCTLNNVYVSLLETEQENHVICMNGHDYLLLDSNDPIQVMNDIMDAFDYYNTWSDRLNENIIHETAQSILDQSAPVLRSMLILTDPAYFVSAHTKAPEYLEDDTSIRSVVQDSIMDLEHIILVENDPRIRCNNPNSFISEAGQFTIPSCIRNLFCNNRHMGWLISAGERPSKGRLHLQDELGDILEKWISLHPDVQNTVHQDVFFTDLMRGERITSKRLAVALHLMKIRETDKKCVYAIHMPENKSGMMLLSRLDSLPGTAYAFMYQERLYVFAAGDSDYFHELEAELDVYLNGVGGFAGRSPFFEEILELPGQHRLAEEAADAGKDGRLRGAQRILHFEDAALYVAEKQLQNTYGTALVHPMLRHLQEYDRINQTEYLPTLAAYLHCERRLADTAKQLFVHRNTLIYRIQRIQEITSLDLDDTAVRLHLLLSLDMM